MDIVDRVLEGGLERLLRCCSVRCWSGAKQVLMLPRGFQEAHREGQLAMQRQGGIQSSRSKYTSLFMCVLR